MQKYILFTILAGFLAASFQNGNEKITRKYPAAIKGDIHHIVPHVIDFTDTIPNDTLLEYTGADGTPLMFSRNILTGVCIDGECRFVSIELFWNPTGRYMGFELPINEFLSKTEHEPFLSPDYDRLHQLLADPLSALAHYSLNELVPVTDSTKKEVDAVSSATVAAVLDYIVEGAVYTTYTLWHIVYGQTKREIEALTAAKLSAKMVLQLLESEKTEDKVWALNHISANMDITHELSDTLISIISGNDVYLAERAINALPVNIDDNNMQLRLAGLFAKAGFLQKRLIIQKLGETNRLETETVESIARELGSLNGTLVKNVLELFQNQRVNNAVAVSEAAGLLKHQNRYIASQAAKYLESLENIDAKTKKELEKFRNKR
jgi:hypothetical protein